MIHVREKYSKKHHFLPVFYLKGFSDDQNLIYVYDKIKDTIIPNQSPQSKFYVNHLNNYRKEGKVLFTYEENLINEFDSMGSKLFSKILSNNFEENDCLSVLEKREVLHFILMLYWRNPDSDQKFATLIKKEGLSNRYFGFGIKGQGEFLPDEKIMDIKNDILNDPELLKIFKFMVPVSDGAMKEVSNHFDKWKIYELNPKLSQTKLITGDMPILVNNDSPSLDNTLNEFIFPLGKSKFLMITEKYPRFLDSTLIAFMNMGILNQSKRYIASDSEQNLREVVINFNKLNKLGLTDLLEMDSFNIIKFQSKHETFDSYKEAYKALSNIS